MERLDVYNELREKQNRTMVRGEPVQPGDYLLVVHICVFNAARELLIQQRQPFKKGWSGLWDLTAGGCAVAGETSRSAAQRELLEELGLHIDLTNIRPHLTVNFDTGFDDIYVVQQEVDLSALTLQIEEVQNVKWASKAEVLSLLETGAFVPYYANLVQLLFDIRHQYGTIRSI